MKWDASLIVFKAQICLTEMVTLLICIILRLPIFQTPHLASSKLSTLNLM
ncbi:hypothetical protein A2U01_0081937, partial [Trifolium medium]|nr:hypothetical protein [Trifolium medium]